MNKAQISALEKVFAAEIEGAPAISIESADIPCAVPRWLPVGDAEEFWFWVRSRHCFWLRAYPCGTFRILLDV